MRNQWLNAGGTALVYAARGVYVQAADLVRLLKHVIVIITVYAIGLHVTSLCLADGTRMLHQQGNFIHGNGCEQWQRKKQSQWYCIMKLLLLVWW